MAYFQFSSILDSPVLHRELIRVGRKVRLHVLRYGFALFILFQMLLMMPALEMQHRKTDWTWPSGQSVLDVRRGEFLAWTESWHRFGLLLLQELFWWIVLITPAVSAGALGHEKERGTLLALFGTQLTSGDIVIGKLLGRLFMVILPALATLPIIVLAAGLGELSLVGVSLALVLLLTVMLAVGAASMLTAIWTRRTTDAILACYAALVIFFIGTVVVFPNSPLIDWIDPGNTLEQIVNRSGHWLRALLWQGLILGSVSAACLTLAIWRLRPACARQEEKRALRWLWAYRRPMGNDPVAWRERHAIGLAPVPWLRLIPAWMGWVGVFTFSAIIAVDSANYATSKGLYTNLEQGNVVGAFHSLSQADPGRVESHVHIMGIVLVLGNSIIIGVRCGNSISEEKRRKTWEDLIITPLTRKQIISGKRRGILYAAIPIFFAYCLPMFNLAAWAGSSGITIAAIYMTISILAMTASAFLGISWADNQEGLSWDAAARIYELIYMTTARSRLLNAQWEIRPAILKWEREVNDGSQTPPGRRSDRNLTTLATVDTPTNQSAHDGHSAMQRLAKRLDALPVLSDAAGVLLLRPDGQVIEVAPGPDAQPQPAGSYRWLVARVAAARLFPELRVLLPPRPQKAGNCPDCAGSGFHPNHDTPVRALCHTCTGLGWVYVPPPEELINADAHQ
jgi:ABC-type transport system involved in multi-copper enzyme maturation permease subunit